MNKVLQRVILYIIVASTYLSLLMNKQTFLTIVKEDEMVEWIGTLFFLSAAIIFFYLYFASRDYGNKILKIQTKRNLFYLFLGILFITAAGEEISWGQRIFGWGTPEYFQSSNIQAETNFHNLNFIETDLIDTNKLFILFWVSYCLVIPLLNRYSSLFNRIFQGINLPVPPLWIGALFLTNYLITQLIELSGFITTKRVNFGLHEIKETNYAFICYVLASQWIINKTSALTASRGESRSSA